MTIHPPPTQDITMNITRPLLALTLGAAATLVVAADGLVAVKSPHNAKMTMD